MHPDLFALLFSVIGVAWLTTDSSLASLHAPVTGALFTSPL